jgi:hypothetical protein
MNLKWRLLLPVCILVAFCASANAQSSSARKKTSSAAQARYTISGRVEGMPASRRATVVAKAHNKPSHSTTTHADGTYILRSVLPGTYEIRASHSLFRFSPAFHTAAVTNHDVENINFVAHEKPGKRR